MDGIYYNQTITEEELNAMATDLGATDFNNFTGVEKFGADKLNEITQSLVSEGILISGDMCRCVKTDTGIIIMPGTIVFASGAKKTISENITIEAANATVVYALNNTAAGTCTIEVAEAFPTDTATDYVPLCEISSGGALTDKRKIANAKCVLTSNGNYNTITMSFKLSSYNNYASVGTIDRLIWDSHNYMHIEVAPNYNGAADVFSEKAFGQYLVNNMIYVNLSINDDGNVDVSGKKYDNFSDSTELTLRILFL